MIRSVPANASDALYCMMLAQNAVHGVMAGYTGFSVGLVNNRVVYIPIPRMVATSPRIMDPAGKCPDPACTTTIFHFTIITSPSSFSFSGSPTPTISLQVALGNAYARSPDNLPPHHHYPQPCTQRNILEQACMIN